MNLLRSSSVIFWIAAIVSLSAAMADAAASGAPENLARRAVVAADACYDPVGYGPHLAADGVVPAEGSQDDVGQAWCVNGAVHGDQAEIRFSWEEAVPIAEIVYYARTAWFINETWRKCAVYLNDAATPAMMGELAMVHGPQRLVLPPGSMASTLVLRFSDSYGGANPGAC